MLRREPNPDLRCLANVTGRPFLVIGSVSAVVLLTISVVLGDLQTGLQASRRYTPLSHPGFQLVHGWIVGSSGDPIRNVIVTGIPGRWAKSAGNGEFLVSASEVVRFSATGFRPVTKSVAELLRVDRIVPARHKQNSLDSAPLFSSRDDPGDDGMVYAVFVA
jgi:hypothetical protein